MSQAATIPGFIPRDMQYSLIEITSYDKKNPCGYVRNPSFEGKKRFDSLMQLILIIDQLHDELAFPRRSTDPRVFGATPDGLGLDPLSGGADVSEEGDAQSGKQALAHLQLNIMFRQNASWQGSLVWIDRAVEAHFRSTLELILLMDSALTELEADG